MFSQDDLDRARAIPVLEIAKRHRAQLRPSGRERVGPCPYCGGVDRFAVKPSENVWNCRGYGGGDPIALEMHLSGGSFVDAVKALIGQDAGTSKRRQPTPEEIAARLAREEQQRREQAAEAARNAMSAERIVARRRPIIGTPGETFLRDIRKIDVTHRAIRRALMDVETLGWCERVFFKQEKPDKPHHELNGQYLGAIVAILTDPVTGQRTGGITRTYVHQGRKVGKAMSLGGVRRLGIIRLSPDDEVLGGLHLAEGLESALSWMQIGFLPLWATGSTVQMENFPVLPGVECLNLLADHDANEAGIDAASAAYWRWKDAGREVHIREPNQPGDANDVIMRRAR
jgi:Toprim domain